MQSQNYKRAWGSGCVNTKNNTNYSQTYLLYIPTIFNPLSETESAKREEAIIYKYANRYLSHNLYIFLVNDDYIGRSLSNAPLVVEDLKNIMEFDRDKCIYLIKRMSDATNLTFSDFYE